MSSELALAILAGIVFYGGATVGTAFAVHGELQREIPPEQSPLADLGVAFIIGFTWPRLVYWTFKYWGE